MIRQSSPIKHHIIAIRLDVNVRENKKDHTKTKLYNLHILYLTCKSTKIK